MEDIERTVGFRVKPSIPAYINQLAAEMTLKSKGKKKVLFSDIIRDYLEEGINTGRLKSFAVDKYTKEEKQAA